ncbi:MAG: hypothetical protein CVV64_00570 [Candidatus Wallbacteria bacterium HGW-Wallbacteria-1]|jgi:methyl-accepting chemotaxis protein|uniref:HAMP domain-containing protein n=1 Tax=Candidatus Wallbacteria bacterium HGW-Wallbacteria-1 TaxID=2013854 RepID=A0A2N1PUC2_9BACT|nr:MAG: hypothetical protein CVV64_00570 [Candidatus Wallbacteria bacterium HGW-Wallbacteria-1]
MAKRTKLIVNRSQQSRFIFTVLLVCLLVLIINAVNIYVLVKHFAMAQAGVDEIQALSRISAAVVEKMRFRIILLVAVNGIIVVGIGLFLSHRIAGPSYNIEREMRQVMDGDISGRVKLREGDQLSELAAAMNQMVDGLRDIVGNIRVSAESLEGEIRKSENPDPRVIAGLNSLNQAIAGFQLSSEQKDARQADIVSSETES